MNLISHIADVASFFSQYWLILVLLALIIVMYVVSFNRRKKYNSQVKEMMDALKPGDKVKTYSGFYGTIVSIKETTDGKVVLLEMGEGNKLGYLTVDANAIYGVDNKQDIVYDKDGNIIEPAELATPKIEQNNNNNNNNDDNNNDNNNNDDNNGKDKTVEELEQLTEVSENKNKKSQNKKNKK